MYKILYIILFCFILTNCTFKPVVKHHGVPFLEKKQTNLITDKSNINDIKRILGNPSTKSKFDNDVWIYIERKITNTHFFGRRELIVNNVLVLEIDQRGLLAKIDFYNIDDMKKMLFSLKASIVEAHKYKTQEDALQYIIKQAMFTPINMSPEEGRQKQREFIIHMNLNLMIHILM